MVDQFTKWVECIPLPNQSAIETAHAAVNNFFSRFGMPFQVFSDQGRNFESKLLTEIYARSLRSIRQGLLRIDLAVMASAKGITVP